MKEKNDKKLWKFSDNFPFKLVCKYSCLHNVLLVVYSLAREVIEFERVVFVFFLNCTKSNYRIFIDQSLRDVSERKKASITELKKPMN